MKKNSFMQGAVVATSSIILSKIIGVVYVMFLYPMLGEKGGALYGYAYSIYSLFLGISIAGIPFAISKITSEYNALEYIYTKEKAYKIGKIFISSLGIISFVLMFFFSKQVGYFFIGDIQGGNTVDDVAFVVKIIATALLFVPILSVTRGYLQGHKFIAASSFSQVVEQFTRVVLLLLGTYLGLNVFKIGLTNSVGIAVFGATFGAFCAYLFLYLKIRKQKGIHKISEIKEEEKRITTKHIMKKIIIYAIPFVLIDLVRSSYTFVDLSNINKVMVSLGYKFSEAESITSIISTWGSKLESIVYAISMGLIISLIPHITSSHALNDKEDIRDKVNSGLQSLLFVVLPLVFMMSILSTPIWTVFYGYNELAHKIFSIFILASIFISIYNLSCSVLNCISSSKTVIVSLIVGLLIKIIFNAPLMNVMHFIGLHPAYGVTLASVIAFGTSSLINFHYIKRKTNIDYKDTFNKLGKILMGVSIMIVVMLLFEFIVPLTQKGRLASLFVGGFYGIIGTSVYLYVMIKTNTIYDIFGKDIFKKIKFKFIKRV